MSQFNLIEVIERKYISDSRGDFLKIMNGSEGGLSKVFGEIYMVRGSPGTSRANHYHIAASEWFTILSGSVTLLLIDIKTNQKRYIDLNSKTPVTVKVPPLVAHSLINSSETEFSLLAYSDVPYLAADTIPYVLS